MQQLTQEELDNLSAFAVNDGESVEILEAWNTEGATEAERESKLNELREKYRDDAPSGKSIFLIIIDLIIYAYRLTHGM